MATVQEKIKYWFYYDATKPGVIKNRICEGTDCLKAALSSVVSNLQVVFVSARSVSWGSNEAVTLLYLVSSPKSPSYGVKTQDLKHYVSHH